MTLELYSLHIDEDVDLERFAANDARFFKDLGDVVSSSEIKKWGVFTKAIEKLYYNDKKKVFCKGRYLTDGTYGYIILGYSIEKKLDQLSSCFDSFETNVPFLTNVQNRLVGIKNKLSGSKSKSSEELIGDLIIAILLFAVPVAIGFIGYATRRTSFGLFLVFVLPLCLTGYLLYNHMKWWEALGIGAICMVLMGAGRVGFFIWSKND